MKDAASLAVIGEEAEEMGALWDFRPLQLFKDVELAEWFTKLDLNVVRAEWLSVSVPPALYSAFPVVPDLLDLPEDDFFRLRRRRLRAHFRL